MSKDERVKRKTLDGTPDAAKGGREKRKTFDGTPDTAAAAREKGRTPDRTPTRGVTPTNGRSRENSPRRHHANPAPVRTPTRGTTPTNGRSPDPHHHQHHHDDTKEHGSGGGGGGGKLPHGLAYLIDDMDHVRPGHHHHTNGHRTPNSRSPAGTPKASPRGESHSRPRGKTAADVKARIKAEAHAIEDAYHHAHGGKGKDRGKLQENLDRIREDFDSSDKGGGVLTKEEEKERRAPPPPRVGKPPPSAAHVQRRRQSVMSKLLTRLGCGRGPPPPPLAHQAQTVALGLGLTPKQLHHLSRAFDRIDISATGYIEYAELLYAMREKERSHYTDIVFDVLDLNGDKLIDFDELVVSMATFCMFSPEECDRLAFDSFDTDRDGVLRGDELQKMIRATEKERAGSAPLSPLAVINGYARSKASPDSFGGNGITYPEFIEVVRNHPMVSLSIRHFQEELRLLTLGTKYFAKLCRSKAETVAAVEHGVPRMTLGELVCSKWLGCAGCDRHQRVSKNIQNNVLLTSGAMLHKTYKTTKK